MSRVVISVGVVISVVLGPKPKSDTALIKVLTVFTYALAD